MSRLLGRGGNDSGGSIGIEAFTPVATTAAGLPVNPKNGSQVLFQPALGIDVILTYDALKGKWVGPMNMTTSGGNPTLSGFTSGALVLAILALGRILNYKTFYDAGLRPEIGGSLIMFNSTAVSNTLVNRWGLGEVSNQDSQTSQPLLGGYALGYVEYSDVSPADTSAWEVLHDVAALTAVTAPTRPHANINLWARIAAGAGGALATWMAWYRWTN